MALSQEQWAFYQANGYLKLGKLLSDQELRTLQDTIDAIMLGTAPVDYSRLLMQLDSQTGKYEDAGAQSKGHKGATRNYRKIQDLEFVPEFLAYLQRPIFADICARHYGPSTPVDVFRAMFMNKPARQGTFLPWHQDRWTYLDHDPLVTIWTALDPATIGNGCVQVVPGSHKQGLINPSHPSGFLTPEQAKTYATPDRIEFLELAPGEAVLLHNQLLHASDINRTDISRRAFSVCYMDARTVCSTGEKFTRVFGPGSLTPAALATPGQPVGAGA